MSFAFRTLDLDSQYKKILTVQTDLIKNNRYVRELEERYHKSHRKFSKESMPGIRTTSAKAHNWPVDSQMFTKVLKSRLDLALSTKKSAVSESASKITIARPRSHCRYSVNDVKQEIRQERVDLSLCVNPTVARKRPQNLSFNYKRRPRRHKSSSNSSPLARGFTRRGIESSLNESIDNNIDEEFRDITLVRIPRYN